MKTLSGDVYKHARKKRRTKRELERTINKLLRESNYLSKEELSKDVGINVNKVRELINDNLDLYKLYVKQKMTAKAIAYEASVLSVESMVANGSTIVAACKKVGISYDCYYDRKNSIKRWLTCQTC